MTVQLHDPQGPSASQAVMEWVRLHSESVTGRQGYAAGYKRDLELEMSDPEGCLCEQVDSEKLYDNQFRWRSA